MIFLPSFSCIFANLSSHFCSLCDTCDSKKTTSLLECARYAYARENFILNLPSLWPIKSVWLFCYVHIAYFGVLKENNALFSDFFPLWGNISPYTYRGAPMICASRFISTFTAKANPTYNTSCIVAFSLPDARTPPAIVAKVSTQNSPKKGLRQKEFFWHSPRVMQGKKLAERLTN